MDGPDALRELAQRCRELAAATPDEETCKSLELLALDYEKRAAESEAEKPRPEMPMPPQS